MDNDTCGRVLLRVGFVLASRVLPSKEDADDCAVEFVWRMLRPGGTCAGPCPAPGRCLPFVRLLARRQAQNYLRGERRRLKHEHPWPMAGPGADDWLVASVRSPDPDPAATLEFKLWLVATAAAIGTLPRRQREGVVRKCFGEREQPDGGTASTRVADAVRRSGNRGATRLRQLLDTEGHSAETLLSSRVDGALALITLDALLEMLSAV